jgi:hypothetical protein
MGKIATAIKHVAFTAAYRRLSYFLDCRQVHLPPQGKQKYFCRPCEQSPDECCHIDVKCKTVLIQTFSAAFFAKVLLLSVMAQSTTKAFATKLFSLAMIAHTC